MLHSLLFARITLTAFALVVTVAASTSLPFERVPLDTLAAFRPTAANWTTAADFAGDPRRDSKLEVIPGGGIVVSNPTRQVRGNLFTTWEHGDLELDLEFLLTPKSNSGIYLQGRYEVQLFDSWAKRELAANDSGSIYQRWDPARGPGKEGFEGHPPLANAARAPGLWQRLQISFRAPRFDSGGRKTDNARFVRVVLNGYVVQENVEVTGPTRAAAFADEQAEGPLMIQGDHGPIALRNVLVKRSAREKISVVDLHYKVYPGSFSQVGSYDGDVPAREGVPDRFSAGVAKEKGNFALVFTGKLNLPRAGTYHFAIPGTHAARLTINGAQVVRSITYGSLPGVVTLPAGLHPFRLDYLHAGNRPPALELVAEGPSIAPSTLTAQDKEAKSASPKEKIMIDPRDRVIVQRGFTPFEPRKRLYTAAVGTPAGVHFAYDFETGAILHAWRGAFIETTGMWEGRGSDQLAKPSGPTLTLNSKPMVALLEYPQRGDWPIEPESLWSYEGYTLEADGLPVFSAKLAELSLRDRIAPEPEGRGLERRLEITGRLPSWSVWVLLAEGDRITPQPNHRGWIIGDRTWFIDWPEGAIGHPIVRETPAGQQLAVLVTAASLGKAITYSIVW